MRITAIGDTHFRVDNINIVEILIQKIVELLRENPPDLIVLLGDILHDHERLHTIAMNKAYEFITLLRDISPVYILVGNHDMINHDQFLTDNHWMNALKHWENVTIIDKVLHLEVEGKDLLFCPFVAPGRFIEALETHNFDWKDSDVIFAHQEFKGCKMGAIISEIGDEWDLDNPFVISGHIHSKQTPQDNIFYTGSSMQVAYGESENNIILDLNLDDSIELQEHILDIPRKKIIYIDIDQFESFELNNSKDYIKLTIKGNYEDFKMLKKSKKYKKLMKDGVKISYKHQTIEKTTKKIHETTDFQNILEELIKKEENLFLQKAFNIING